MMLLGEIHRSRRAQGSEHAKQDQQESKPLSCTLKHIRVRFVSVSRCMPDRPNRQDKSCVNKGSGDNDPTPPVEFLELET